MVVVAVVLLIACANIANLLLARTTGATSRAERATGAPLVCAFVHRRCPGARAILSVSEEMQYVFWVAVAALLAAFPFISSGLAKDKAALTENATDR